ncbi:MAG: sigma-70 family RNA polymerase sigma factor [Bryobacteraceae bacterium]
MDTTLALSADFDTSTSVAGSPVVSITDDAELARAARAGNRVSFGRLYDRYAKMVHAILLARVPRSEVDDLVQDVFLSALRQLSNLRQEGAFGGWLAMIARNRAHDYHRRSREWAELPDNLPSTDRRSPDALAALDAIRNLPVAYREPLLMRLVEGMTGEEIASRTGMTAPSVRVNLHRGMKMLRQKLNYEGRSNAE